MGAAWCAQAGEVHGGEGAGGALALLCGCVGRCEGVRGAGTWWGCACAVRRGALGGVLGRWPLSHAILPMQIERLARGEAERTG